MWTLEAPVWTLRAPKRTLEAPKWTLKAPKRTLEALEWTYLLGVADDEHHLGTRTRRSGEVHQGFGVGKRPAVYGPFVPLTARHRHLPLLRGQRG
eukprot:8492056-Pyramimonas_sp.AAC.1